MPTPPHQAALLAPALLWHLLRSGSAAGEFLRFGLVGGSAAVAYVVLTSLLTIQFSLPPAAAIALALCVLIPPTYLAQRALAFRSARPHRTAFPRYLATQAGGNLLGIAVAAWSGPWIRQYPWLSFTAVAAVTVCANYSILKLWAFAHEPRQPE